MYCQKCGTEIMDEAIICPNCGCATSNYNVSKNISKKAKAIEKPIDDQIKDVLTVGIISLGEFVIFLLIYVSLGFSLSPVNSFAWALLPIIGLTAAIAGLIRSNKLNSRGVMDKRLTIAKICSCVGLATNIVGFVIVLVMILDL